MLLRLKPGTADSGALFDLYVSRALLLTLSVTIGLSLEENRQHDAKAYTTW